MIQTPKNLTDPKACFHCGRPTTKVPGYAAVCPPCENAQAKLQPPRNLELLQTLAKIATQCPQLRLGQILGNVADTNKGLFYVSDSELHNRLKKFLRDNA
jgi:hypothetical protein